MEIWRGRQKKITTLTDGHSPNNASTNLTTTKMNTTDLEEQVNTMREAATAVLEKLISEAI